MDNLKAVPNEETALAVIPEKTVSLKELRDKNIANYRKEQETKKLAAKAQISKSEWEVAKVEFEEMFVTYKLENGLPLDKGVDLVTGKSLP